MNVCYYYFILTKTFCNKYSNNMKILRTIDDFSIKHTGKFGITS